ncbi:hypothetical protein [Fusobacterium perfoetens]|uniref:hypothetical protein n=1 Tax=Fusobacterium perfoetens TaxID=852 RepID=UPI0026EE59E3|nr:hypothetical protein [Fusobacterium perfoetens]
MKKNKKIILSIDNIIVEMKNEMIDILKKYFIDVEYFFGSEPSKDSQTFLYKKLKQFSRYKNTPNFIKNLYSIMQEDYYLKNLKKFKDVDYVLTIGGVYYNPKFIKLVKEQNLDIKFICFLWDKYPKNIIDQYKENYDCVYTFEKDDAKANGIIWQPSFYLENKQLEYKEKKLDCYYLGNLRDNHRYEILKQMEKISEKYNLTVDLKLYSSKKSKDKLITNKKISYKENLEYIKKSKVSLEINIKGQKGLTLRALECLAYNTKLITTNEDILNYDFYNQNNIKIIRSKEDLNEIPIDFFKNNYVKIPQDIKNKYSFEGFIKEIFKEEI